MRRLEKWVVNASIIVLFQFFTESVFAQDTTIVQRFDMYAERLKKSEMKTSVLYDRVFSFAKLNKQNYTDTERNEIPNNYKNWKQIYLEMYNADYANSSKESFEKYLAKTEEFSIQQKAIPIGILNYNFEYIDTNAFRDGRIYLKDGFPIRNVDVPNTPFIMDSIRVLSILGEQLYTGITKLIFDRNFYYTNTNKYPKSIRLNFNNDKGWIELNEGEAITLFFDKAENLKYSYEIVFDNNEIITSDAFVKIVSSGTSPCYSFKHTTFTEYLDYDGNKSGARYEIGVYLNNCTTRDTNVFRNPIIIADGFDPSDTRKIGNIFDLMNEAPIKLADTLLAKGYDIIICNFLKGADFIERNALAVEEVINYVKSKTKDKIIVIGPSMGGLVTKVALNNFEAKNKDHQTSLYFSFDSPHQGANIPIADQYFLDFYGRIVGNAEAEAGLNQIKTPAAKEMLLDYYEKDHVYPVFHKFRDSYIANNMSYPKHLRKISLVNGSGVSKLQGVNGKLFSLLITTKLFNITLAEAQVYSSPNRGISQAAYLMAANKNNLTKPHKTKKYTAVESGTPYPINICDVPGGYFNTQEIITGLSKGQSGNGFQVFHSIHSFIPTVSALDVKFPTNFSNYTLNIDNANIVCSGITPFDAFFAPKNNEMHVSVTNENVAWIKREIFNASKTTTVTSKSDIISSNDIYNYGGETKNYYDKSFTVTNGGILGVNLNQSAGRGNEVVPLQGSVFKVDGYNSCSSSIIIDVLNNSQVILGDKNSNIGELTISENSILKLSNSNLKIFNYSKLTIAKDSKLIIGKDTKIELIGENAQLVINGEIEFVDDSKLDIIGNGKIIFNNKQLNFAKNSKLTLIGTEQNNLKIVFNDEAFLHIPENVNNEQNVKMRFVQVQFNSSNNYLFSASGINLENTSFNGGRGLVLNGQDNIRISNCSFSKNKIGVTCYSNSNRQINPIDSVLALSNCKFYACDIAVKMLGKGFNFDLLEIEKCKQAIVADGIDEYSKLSNSTIIADELQSGLTASNSAISFVGINGSTLEISNSTISKFNVGVYHSQSTLNLKCSNITNSNFRNIWVAHNAVLNIGPSGNSYSGNNYFSVKNEYCSNIFLEQANNIFVANGANKFKLNGLSNNYYVAGTMFNLPESVNAQYNNWYDNLRSTQYLNSPKQSNFLISKTAGPSSIKVSSYNLFPILGTANFAECTNYFSKVKDPCETPGDCSNYLFSDPLVYAEHAKNVNVEGFNEGPLNIVLKEVLTKFKNNDSESNLHVCFNALTSLSEINETYENDDIAYLMDLSYASAMEAFNRLRNNKSIDNELLRINLENLIANRINYFKQHKNNAKLFSSLMDLAQLNISYHKFDEATNVFYEALSIAESISEINLANHWICLTRLKRSIILENLSVEEIDLLENECGFILEDGSSSAPTSLSKDTLAFNPSNISIAPNPITDEFSICANNAKEYILEVVIRDMQGRVVLKSNANDIAQKLTIDVSAIDNGIYNISLKTNLRKSNYKISVQK